MLKTLFKILAFLVASFLILEQSYRVYVVGPGIAFNPARFNSMVSIMYTDLVELSPHPEVFFQLKPNLDTWFSGQRFRTNSAGLADREYTLQKPDDVFRIAVIGSSWSMATGVTQDQTYQALIEAELNEQFPGQKFEVINFACEMYGLRELIGTLRHRVVEWEPDLVIASVTSYTAYVLWDDPDAATDVLPEKRHPFFRSYVLRLIASRLGTNWFKEDRSERAGVGNDKDLYREQLLRFFDESSAIAKANDFPLAFMWLSWGAAGGSLHEQLLQRAAELDVTFIEGYRWIAGTPEIIRGRQISQFDNHPNAGAHRRIAGKIMADIKQYQLIPGVE